MTPEPGLPAADPSDAPARRASWLPIAGAAALAAAAYVALTFVTLNLFGPVLLIVGLLALLVAAQYLLWGRALERFARQAEADEQAQRAFEAKDAKGAR